MLLHKMHDFPLICWAIQQNVFTPPPTKNMLVRQTVNFPKSRKMLNAGLSTAFLLKKKVAEENDAGTGNLYADSDSEDGGAFIGESRHFGEF